MGAVACDSKVPLASIHVFCAPVGPDDAAARRGGRSYGALPGESAKEYRWRSDAEEWRAVARDGLGGRYCSCARSCRPLDANGQAALQAELREIAVLLDVAEQSILVGGTRRVETPGLPVEPVREVLVNAVIYRDYLLTHTDVELGLYPDRLEIVSPGRLPNGVTVERMLAGTRAARNELLKDVMRDYGYLEHMGLGVPRKIVRGMQEFNGSIPEFIVGEERLTVVLRR